MKDSVYVILKVSEMCPLRCSYCYFFKGNMDVSSHPKLMSESVIIDTVAMLKTAQEKHGINHITVCFHGGEPLMLQKNVLDWICTYFKESIPGAKIYFSIQTNAVLVDEEWADLINKHDIGVGISIDGTKEQHNRFRIDANGNGSYERTVSGLKTLQNHAAKIKTGVLSVIDPSTDSVKIYRHFVDDLKITSMDFLLLHVTFKDAKNIDHEKLSKYLIRLFDEWISDNNPKIRIRCFDSILSILMGGRSYLKGSGPDNDYYNTPITIFSNGDIAPPSEFCAAGDEFMNTGMNVATSSFMDIFNHPSFLAIEGAYNSLADKCKECRWKNVCAGGSGLNRFSETNGFDNPSAYCQCLDELFHHAARFLVKTGYSVDSLMDTILGNKSTNQPE